MQYNKQEGYTESKLLANRQWGVQICSIEVEQLREILDKIVL